MSSEMCYFCPILAYYGENVSCCPCCIFLNQPSRKSANVAITFEFTAYNSQSRHLIGQLLEVETEASTGVGMGQDNDMIRYWLLFNFWVDRSQIYNNTLLA